MRDEVRWCFAAAVSRELLHAARNTRHVAKLSREVFQRRRLTATATRPTSRSMLRAR